MYNTIKKGSKGEDVKVLQKKLGLMEDGIFGNLTEEAVIKFQKDNGLTPDGIVGAKTWEALLGNISGNPRKISEIIVHCTATPEGKDYDIATIRSWHLARGFNDIGYHYVISRDGTVMKGRSENISGAHCTGHNSISIGVCYVGGLATDGKTPKDTRTNEQKESLIKLLKELKSKYPGAKIHSHRDFAPKACPCFDATSEYKGL